MTRKVKRQWLQQNGMVKTMMAFTTKSEFRWEYQQEMLLINSIIITKRITRKRDSIKLIHYTVTGNADLYELIKILNQKLNLNHLFLQKDECLKWSSVKVLLNHPNNWMARRLVRTGKENTMILNNKRRGLCRRVPIRQWDKLQRNISKCSQCIVLI